MKIIKIFLWGLLVILLAACTNTSTVPTPTNTPTLTHTSSPTPLLETKQPTAALPSPTPTPTLAPTISPSVIEGLRMAYIIDGNLYLQDGTNPPLPLTNDERRDQNLAISDDGEKIVFLRGLIPYDLYSINPDGSQEQLLVSGSELSKLGLGYDELLSEILFFEFIPGTHQLIVRTHELDESDLDLPFRGDLWGRNNFDLLLVDADTAEIRSIFPPGERSGYSIAPTGDMIAISRLGHIDLVDINGQIIRENLFTYIPTEPDPVFPDIFWSKDATELFVTLPIKTEHPFEDRREPLDVWRIAIDGSSMTQISFEPPLLEAGYTISPDGNWVLYDYFDPYYYDENITYGLFLGNFLEGGSQLLVEGYTPSYWSPDSFHFIYGRHDCSLGATNGQLDTFSIQGLFLGWIDARHFLLFDDYYTEMVTIAGIDGAMINIPFSSTVIVAPEKFAFVYINPNP